METLIAAVNNKIRQGELLEAIDLLSRAWNVENPDWEIAVATMPRGNLEERKRTLAFAFKLLEMEDCERKRGKK